MKRILKLKLFILLASPVVLNQRGFLLPRGYLATSGDIFDCHSREWEGLLLASTRWRPGMLLNVLQDVQDGPHNEELLAPNVNSAKVGKL